MSNTIYVGNLKWEVTENSLKELFAPIGEVTSVKIVMDRVTGKPRGFAFVVMENIAEAIKQLNGKDFMGRTLKINEATPRENKPFTPHSNAPRPFTPNSNEYTPKQEFQREYTPKQEPFNDLGLRTPYREPDTKEFGQDRFPSRDRKRSFGQKKDFKRKSREYDEY